jgi:hypothetical protein
VETLTANTAWGSRLSTTKGRELYRAIHDNNYLAISPGTPTYWSTDANIIADLLDFFITNGISESYVSVRGSYDLSSDHTPIITTTSTSIPLRQPQPRLHNSKTNWEHFRTILESTIQLTSKLKTPDDIETEYRQYIILLQEAAKRATPIFTLRAFSINILLRVKKLPRGEPDPPGKGFIPQSTKQNITNSAIN